MYAYLVPESAPALVSTSAPAATPLVTEAVVVTPKPTPAIAAEAVLVASASVVVASEATPSAIVVVVVVIAAKPSSSIIVAVAKTTLERIALAKPCGKRTYAH